MMLHPHDHVGQVVLRVDAVCDAARDQRLQDRQVLAGGVVADK
jgi:hypothetical protein